ncbi:MAG: phenylacetate--CoA ligase family protein [Methylococcaceae bacterium]
MFSHILYRCSPVWMQELLIAIRSAIRKVLREDRYFRQFLADIELQQYDSIQQLEQLHKKELAVLLNRAESAIPFYQHSHEQAHITSTDPRQRLALFPLLHKKTIIANPNAFIASDTQKYPRFSNFTSGTTGTPLTMLQTLNSIKQENAFVRRQMYWAGYKEGDKLAWLRGDMIVPATEHKPPFWRMNRYDNTLMLSSYHLSKENTPAYLDALSQFNPVLIQAYPSSIAYLANGLLQRGQATHFPALKGIMTSSETLTDTQRECIETAFGVRVFDWYGSVERVAAIGTCEYGHYHIIEDYSFVECGTTAEEGISEIIGSCFHNTLMPLIRYATGDLIELETPDTLCQCKRTFRRVKRVLGRMDATIKTPDGRSIGRLDHIYKGISGIIEAQIVQESLDTIEIRVVPANNSGLPTATKQQLVSNLQARIGLNMTICITEVPSLPKTKSGKLLAVISKLN